MTKEKNMFNFWRTHKVTTRTLSVFSTSALIFSLFVFPVSFLRAEDASEDTPSVTLRYTEESFDNSIAEQVLEPAKQDIVAETESNNDIGTATNLSETENTEENPNSDISNETNNSVDTGNQEKKNEASGSSGGSSGSVINNLSNKFNLDHYTLSRLKSLCPECFELEKAFEQTPLPPLCLKPDNLGDDELIKLGSNASEPPLQDILDNYTEFEGLSQLNVFEDQENYQIWDFNVLNSKKTADLNVNGIVDASDLLLILDAWGPCYSIICQADINGNGEVGQEDLKILLSLWGTDGSFYPEKADINEDGIVNVEDLAILLNSWEDCLSDCSADLNGDDMVNDTDLQILLSFWGAVNSQGLIVTIDATFVAKYASNAQVFGYYRNSDTETFTPIFRKGNHTEYADVPELNEGESSVFTIPFFASFYTDNIGFAISSQDQSGESLMFASENSLNKEEFRQTLVYDRSGEASQNFILAFEDILLESSDKDFNDMVVGLEVLGCGYKPQESTISTDIIVLNDEELKDLSTVVGESYEVFWKILFPMIGQNALTGSVTVTDSYSGECTSDIVEGQTEGSCEITSTTANEKKIVASYSGDKNHNPSISEGNPHLVDKADTTTVITNVSDLGTPSFVGEPYVVSWDVTVDIPGAGDPTGTVTVTENGSFGCSASIDAGECSITPATSGEKTLISNYDGDDNFNNSSSQSVLHTVNTSTPPPGGGDDDNDNNSGGGSSSGGFLPGIGGGGQVQGSFISSDELRLRQLELLGLLHQLLTLLQSRLQDQETLAFEVPQEAGEVLSEFAQAQEIDLDEPEENLDEEIVFEEETLEAQSSSRAWLWILLLIILAILLFLVLRKKKEDR